jgi:molecular chaperone DnaK
VYTAEKTKTDLADKLNADILDRMNGAITGVKAALEGKDIAQIKSETEKLQKVLGEAGSAAYQEVSRRQAQQQAGPQEAPPGGDSGGNAGGPGDENVVDADFKVHDDK